jgi:hypothetical protein
MTYRHAQSVRQPTQIMQNDAESALDNRMMQAQCVRTY